MSPVLTRNGCSISLLPRWTTNERHEEVLDTGHMVLRLSMEDGRWVETILSRYEIALVSEMLQEES